MKSINALINAPLYSEYGKKIGKIDDVVFNETTGFIEFLSIQPINDQKQKMRVRLGWNEVVSNSGYEGFELNNPSNAAKRLLTDASG